MRIIQIEDDTQWIVSNSTHLVSPAGYEPSTKVVGLKAGVDLKQYTINSQAIVEKMALKDFPNAKELMIWNVADHYAKYQ